jgi:hypothetical protein
LFSDEISKKFKGNSIHCLCIKKLDSIVLFRGTTQKILNAMLYDNIEPFTESVVVKRVPPISMDLHFVYGFQSYERRNTLFYAYYSQPKKDSEKKKTDIKTVGISQNEKDMAGSLKNKDSALFLSAKIQNEILYSRNQENNEDKNEYRERYFVYFVSRVAIIYNPLSNEQRFYQGHKFRITALAMHPSSTLQTFT